MNKRVVVIYRSGSGFTKKYATWLAEELHCDLLEGKHTKISDITNYDTIIYGGGLYAVGVNGIKLIIKNYEKLQGKQIIIFAVGASPVRDSTTEQVRLSNIPKELLDKIQFFYLRGGFDFNKLNAFMKALMLLKKIQLKNMKNPDADAKGMLAGYDHPMDFTNKKYIQPILEMIRSH